MTIMQIPQYWNKNILILGLIAVLTACGGGGGGNDNDPTDPPPPVSDTTPDSFTFITVSNADVNAVVESNSITVDGINAAAAISITGGEYKIASGEYTTSNNTVTDGQSVTVRLTTSETGSTTNQATLTIGNISATFSVTTRPDDTTPDTFTFPAVTDAAVETQIISETVIISGINTAIPISITGGEYSIAGGSYTAANGTITNDQTVAVRLNSSADTNTETQAVLTIGELSAHFSVTTAPDTTPATFSFTPITDAALGAALTSNQITVSDIDVAVPISITSGEYAIDDGDFTAVESTVNAGQEVVVRATASGSLNTSRVATLNIGGVQGSFEITTLADTTAPVAEFMFPPPVSMTDSDSILVRGITTDDYSEITSVTVNGIEVETLDSYETWQVELPLLIGEDNNLLIQTTDSAGNISIDGDVKAMVRQGVITEAFPDTNNQFSSVVGIAIDRPANRLITVSGDDPEVMTVNLLTGERTPFFEPQPFGPSGSIWGVALDHETNELYLKDSSRIRAIPLNTDSVRDINNGDLSYGLVLLLDRLDPELKVISATNWGGEVISTNSALSEVTIISSSKGRIPDAENPIGTSYGIALDESHYRYLVTDADNQKIISVDRLSGARSIFSDNTVGTGEPFGEIGLAGITGIAIDKENGRAIVTEALSGKIFSVDLLTGNRALLSGPDVPNTSVELIESYGIAIHNPSSYVFVSDRVLKAIVAVDLVTGHRVIFSKSENP
ncbi:hypothetical protein ACSV5M_03140 [Cellvibrio sp. ARAG 10.3]|uniref:hypothetical protein n=1 Tax=Cellvibrio sp. ARAG 10.3 TaxID=3451358 RepID=UPI003F452827